MKNSITAIILAAGQGKRMNSSTKKQYMTLGKYPILYYSLKAFDDSEVRDIILVTGQEDIDYCKRDIIDKYNIKKVSKIIEGGKERYDSVYNALNVLADSEYVLIHDGARPFVDEDIIKRSIEAVKEYGASTVGIPVTDTIKIVDEECFGIETPNRKYLWHVQTPQMFKTTIIKSAYEKMFKDNITDITDDTMIVEQYESKKTKVILGSYKNIKITTFEDLKIAEKFLKKDIDT